MSLIFTEYHKMSLSELVGLVARLNIIIEDKRREQRTGLLRDMRQVAEANGYELSDLIAGVKRKSDNTISADSNGAVDPANPGAAAAPVAGTSAGTPPGIPPAKAESRPLIRDPATGKTWTGRGRRPAWYKPEMASARETE